MNRKNNMGHAAVECRESREKSGSGVVDAFRAGAEWANGHPDPHGIIISGSGRIIRFSSAMFLSMTGLWFVQTAAWLALFYYIRKGGIF